MGTIKPHAFCFCFNFVSLVKEEKLNFVAPHRIVKKLIKSI